MRGEDQAGGKVAAPITVPRFLADRLRRHLGMVLLSVFFALGAVLVQVQTAALVKHFIDDALNRRDMHMLVESCALVVALFLFDGVTDFFHRFFLRIAAERTVRELRNEIYERFLIFAQPQLTRYNSSQAVNHVVMDTLNIGLGLFVLADLIREPLVMIGLIGYLFYLNWKLSLVCFVAIPFVAWAGKGLGRSARRNQERYQLALDKVTQHVMETMGGMRTAHAFSFTGRLRDEFTAKNLLTYGYLIRLARTEELVNPLTKWITSWVGAALLGYGGSMVVNGDMTPGGLIAFVTAAGLLQQPLRQLNNVNVRLQRVLASAARVHEIVLAPLDELANAQTKLLAAASPTVRASDPRKSAHLEFRSLGFRYPVSDAASGRSWSLENISGELAPGKKLALVGRSGSGKSTLSLLALRFLDPGSGQVLLNGRAASEWELWEYRRHFSYVSQDVFLFDRSVRENLLLARPEASDAQLWAALDRAHIRPFIEGLPQQLDTRVGEHGGLFSGGERQRLGIARAFLKDAPILVLDEATSQLDAHSERAIAEALRELMQDRSVLVIAHRLSTIREVDQVWVLEDGVVREQGAPGQLLENSQGAFARLWNAQEL